MMKIKILVIEIFDGLRIIISNKASHYQSKHCKPLSPSCKVFDLSNEMRKTSFTRVCQHAIYVQNIKSDHHECKYSSKSNTNSLMSFEATYIRICLVFIHSVIIIPKPVLKLLPSISCLSKCSVIKSFLM